MASQDLELVVLWNFEAIQHGLVDKIAHLIFKAIWVMIGISIRTKGIAASKVSNPRAGCSMPCHWAIKVFHLAPSTVPKNIGLKLAFARNFAPVAPLLKHRQCPEVQWATLTETSAIA